MNPAEGGRGGKGAASGGGSELRGLLSEPSGRSASCRQSREAKPTASADSRAERERSWSEGEQGSGERASFEERRRRGTRRRAPENLASAPSGDSERVASRPVFWPSGDSYASCRRRAGAPGEQAPKRRGADTRGGFSPFLPWREEKTYELGEDEAWRASCGRSRRRLKASRRRAFQSPEGCPEGARPKARSVTGRGTGTDGAELGRREVADRRSGARGARRGGGGAVSVGSGGRGRGPTETRRGAQEA